MPRIRYWADTWPGTVQTSPDYLSTRKQTSIKLLHSRRTSQAGCEPDMMEHTNPHVHGAVDTDCNQAELLGLQPLQLDCSGITEWGFLSIGR
jgi:hypothetical protein